MQKSQLSPQPSVVITPSGWRLFFIWLGIGVQSFGGGTATLLLIRQTMIYKRGWITEDEYNRYFALCQIAPGINIIALAILIGRKLAGWPGILGCLIGLLVPSAVITTFLTAGFSYIQNWSPMRSALRGIIPATAGLSTILALQLGQPLIKRSRQEGKSSMAISVGFIVASAFFLALFKLPVLLVLFAAAAIGAALFAGYEYIEKGQTK